MYSLSVTSVMTPEQFVKRVAVPGTLRQMLTTFTPFVKY